MIGRFFSALLAKFSAVLHWFGDLYVACYSALWDLIRDAACWPFEQLLTLATNALGAIDASPIVGALGIFNQIPPGVVEVMAAVGAGPCFSIIGAALVIRFILQLIPFVRLGS